jgi:aminopeptidase N
VAYPSVAVSERTRQLAATLIDTPGLNQILRRVVQDSDDDMRRALIARG